MKPTDGTPLFSLAFYEIPGSRFRVWDLISADDRVALQTCCDVLNWAVDWNDEAVQPVLESMRQDEHDILGDDSILLLLAAG